MDLDVIYYRHNKLKPPLTITKSQIMFWDLTFVFSGVLTYRIDGADVNLTAGDAILLPANSLRERHFTDAPVDYVSFNFNVSTPPELPVYLSGTVKNDIKLLIAALDEIALTQQIDGSVYVKNTLSCILSCLKSNLDKKSVNPLIVRIENYLSQNYRLKITLDDISAFTYFSKTYCDVVFKKAKGKSINDYLIDIRISEAKKHLIEGASLTAVSEAAGFADYNYFSRTFKKRVGYSPKTYQSLILKKSP